MRSDERPGDAAMPSPVDVAAIRERWANATPGPWHCFRDDLDKGNDWSVGRPDAESDTGWYYIATTHTESRADAVAIAHAPSDIQALIEEVARLRAALEAGRGD